MHRQRQPLSLDELDSKIEKTRRELETLRNNNRPSSLKSCKQQRFHLGKLANSVRRQSRKNLLQLYGDAFTTLEGGGGGSYHHRHHHAVAAPRGIALQQAQLCRCLHLMEVHHRQIDLMKHHSSVLIQSVKKHEMQTMQQEVSRVEMDYMNKLMKLDSELRIMRDGLGIVVEEEEQHDPKSSWQDSFQTSVTSNSTNNTSMTAEELNLMVPQHRDVSEEKVKSSHSSATTTASSSWTKSSISSSLQSIRGMFGGGWTTTTTTTTTTASQKENAPPTTPFSNRKIYSRKESLEVLSSSFASNDGKAMIPPP